MDWFRWEVWRIMTPFLQGSLNPLSFASFEPSVVVSWLLMTLPITVMGVYLSYRKKMSILAVCAWLILCQLALYPQIEYVLGWPKPFAWELHKPKKLQVIAAVLAPDRAIYVWLDVPGASAPVSYRIAWDKKVAQGLTLALEGQQRRGSKIWYEPSLNKEHRFYNPPPRALPPKTVEEGDYEGENT